MVGGFSKIPDFDPERFYLELKTEYVDIGEITKNLGNIIVTFNSYQTPEYLYPYYYQNGMDFLFNLMQI